MSTSTQDVKPDSGVLGDGAQATTPLERREEDRRVRRSGSSPGRDRGRTDHPEPRRGSGDRPDTSGGRNSGNTVEASAMEVATGFLEAFGALDVERAMTYLADDATIASMGADDDLRLLISWLEATGYRQILNSCEQGGAAAPGSIRCTYDFHALRSGEIGRGPYGGSSFDLTVRNGKIVQAAQNWEIEKFSPQVWEPFANWVSKAYPKDAAVMYQDESHSGVRLSAESIRLWELRTQEYVHRS